MKNAAVLYFSAYGNTKKVAYWIAEELTARGVQTALINIPVIKATMIFRNINPLVGRLLKAASLIQGRTAAVFKI